MPNGRCRMHGGRSLFGPAAAGYKHGRYSKVLPARMQQSYQEAAGDDDLLALRAEIALIDARIQDVLKRVDSGESGKVWQDAQAAWLGFVAANEAKDGQKRQKHAGELDRLIRRGVSDSLAWSEVTRLLDQRRRLVESERKRLVDLQQMITAERALVLLTAVLAELKDSVTKHTDKKTGNRILTDASTGLRRLVAVDAG